MVVVSEKAQPPVAKIIDFQKFKYQQAKKERSGAVKQKAADTKEVRFTPFMAANDFANRQDRARQFLADGYRVKIVVKFQGRQITRKDFGDAVLKKAGSALIEFGTQETAPKLQGKLMWVTIGPKKGVKNHEEKKSEN